MIVAGAFANYLKSTGIIKQKGIPYTKRHPARGERINQTIARPARAALLASHLPLKFYVEAQKTQAYLYNRQVHSGHTLTPFEQIFNRKPDLSNLFPFLELASASFVFCSSLIIIIEVGF